jgi:hypothetical protein
MASGVSAVLTGVRKGASPTALANELLTKSFNKIFPFSNIFLVKSESPNSPRKDSSLIYYRTWNLVPRFVGQIWGYSSVFCMWAGRDEPSKNFQISLHSYRLSELFNHGQFDPGGGFLFSSQDFAISDTLFCELTEFIFNHTI